MQKSTFFPGVGSSACVHLVRDRTEIEVLLFISFFGLLNKLLLRVHRQQIFLRFGIVLLLMQVPPTFCTHSFEDQALGPALLCNYQRMQDEPNQSRPKMPQQRSLIN